MAPLFQMGMLFKINTFALHNDMLRDHELDSDFYGCLSTQRIVARVSTCKLIFTVASHHNGLCFIVRWTFMMVIDAYHYTNGTLWIHILLKNWLKNVLFSLKKWCIREPVHVQKNVSFVVNVNTLNDPMDICADDNGVWMRKDSPVAYVSKHNKGDATLYYQHKDSDHPNCYKRAVL